MRYDPIIGAACMSLKVLCSLVDYCRMRSPPRQNPRSITRPQPAPQVTIGIPLWNNAATLPATLQSIYAQTFTDWELILVDDGSQDGTLQLARSVQDARVRVYADGRRRGPQHRGNQIARMARAPLLSRLDADDLMHPRRLERQVSFLEQEGACDLVASQAYSFADDYHVRGIRRSTRQSAYELLKRNLILHPSVTGRTQWWRANPYDRRFLRLGDKELWARTWRQCRMMILDEPLLFYRENASDAFWKFRAVVRGDAAILLKYGPALVGRTKTAALLAQLGFRFAAHAVAAGVGLRAQVVSSRCRPMAAEELEEAAGALRRLLATYVPGMTEVLAAERDPSSQVVISAA